MIRAGTYSFPEAIDGYRTTWSSISEQAKALVERLKARDEAKVALAGAAGKRLQGGFVPNAALQPGKKREVCACLPKERSLRVRCAPRV